jgi:hypothetical protein
MGPIIAINARYPWFSDMSGADPHGNRSVPSFGGAFPRVWTVCGVAHPVSSDRLWVDLLSTRRAHAF